MTRAQVLRTVAAALVTLGVLLVVALKVEPGPIIDALEGLSPAWVIAAALVALLFNTLQSAEAFRWALRSFGVRIGYGTALTATAGNMAIKAALPAGAGELARVAWLHRTCSVDPMRSTAAIAALLWLKLLWLLAISLAGSLLVAGQAVTRIALLASLCLAASLPLVARRWMREPDDARGWHRIAAALGRTTRAARPASLVLCGLHALLAVTAEIGVFAMLLHACGGRVDAVHIAAWIPLVIIAAKVPLTLMGLGAREGLVVLLLAGSSPEAVLAASALLFSAVEYVLPAAVGTALTWSYVRRILGPGGGTR
jgi:uncharacterized membrane protein YbhN (UPF0104 family)